MLTLACGAPSLGLRPACPLPIGLCNPGHLAVSIPLVCPQGFERAYERRRSPCWMFDQICCLRCCGPGVEVSKFVFGVENLFLAAYERAGQSKLRCGERKVLSAIRGRRRKTIIAPLHVGARSDARYVRDSRESRCRLVLQKLPITLRQMTLPRPADPTPLPSHRTHPWKCESRYGSGVPSAQNVFTLITSLLSNP